MIPEQLLPVRVAPPVATMPLLRGVARLLSQLASELLVHRRPLLPPPALPPLPPLAPPLRPPAPPAPPPPHQPAEAGVARASTAPTPAAAAIERIAYLLICFSPSGLQGPLTDELPVTADRGRIERRHSGAIARERDSTLRAQAHASRRRALAIVLRAVVRHPATGSGAPTGARTAASASRRGIGEGEQRAHRSARRDSEDRDPLHRILLCSWWPIKAGPYAGPRLRHSNRRRPMEPHPGIGILDWHCNTQACNALRQRVFRDGALTG